MIIYLLNKFNYTNSADVYGWITTETIDTVVFSLCTKIGIHGLSDKYIILLILTFII